MTVETRTARVAGVEVFWRDAGSGRPVLLLHGLGASSYSWRSVIEPLARRFRVLAPDFPGYGRSRAPDGFDHSLAGYARWLAAFMDHLGAPRADLAGNSMGGVVALTTVLDAPERAGRVALIGTPTYLTDRPMLMWPLRWPVVGRVYERLLGEGLVKLVGRTAYRDPSVMTPDVVQEYSLALRRPEGRRAVAQFLRNAVPPDVDARIGRYPSLGHELLVICGDSDGVVSLASARRFCREAPKARLVELSGCGHAAQEERPAEVAAALEEFFDGR